MNKATLEQYLHIGSMIKAGELDRQQVQAMIEGRLATPSTPSIRETQARRLYELRFGEVLGCTSFEDYLDGTDVVEAVPQIPNFPEMQVRLFGREGVYLIDGRVVEKVGLAEYCKLLGLVYTGNDDTFESHDPKRAKTGVRWMLGQDGFRNRGRKPNDCRELFQPFEVGMDVVEGASVYALNPKAIEGHYLDLPGSVHREDRGFCAFLGVFDGEPGLHWSWDGYSPPECGSASRGE